MAKIASKEPKNNINEDLYFESDAQAKKYERQRKVKLFF